jgi:acyl-CoA reductase-like NAD-dependent aldehyde dehydrogenase
LLDLEHAKNAVLNGLTRPDAQQGYRHAITSSLIGRDPLDPQMQIGPIASKTEFDKVMRYVESGKAAKARLAVGGTRKVNGKGLFIEPTLFADATNDMQISREEIFGPVPAHHSLPNGRGSSSYCQ